MGKGRPRSRPRPPMIPRGGKNAAGLTMEQWCDLLGKDILYGAVMRFLRGHRIAITKSSKAEFAAAATIGMLESFHDFDPSRGMKPSSYATSMMQWAMHAHNDRRLFSHLPFSVGQHQASRLRRMRAAAHEYRRKHGVNPPGKFWEGFESSYYKQVGKGRYRYNNRLRNLLMMQQHASCDVLVHEDGGGEWSEINCWVDCLPNDEPLTEDVVERKEMFGHVLDYLQSRYDSAAIDRFMRWLASPKSHKFQPDAVSRSGKRTQRLTEGYRMLKDVRRAFA